MCEVDSERACVGASGVEVSGNEANEREDLKELDVERASVSAWNGRGGSAGPSWSSKDRAERAPKGRSELATDKGIWLAGGGEMSRGGQGEEVGKEAKKRLGIGTTARARKNKRRQIAKSARRENEGGV